MSASRSRSCWRTAPALAEDGVGAIALDIEELPPVAGSARFRARRDPVVRREPAPMSRWSSPGSRATPTRRFARPPTSGASGSQVQRYTALPMEPRGVLAEWDAAQGRMTVLGAAKVPFFNRDTLAAMLGLSPAQCRPDRERCRRRLRRPRRVLSRGLPDPVRRAACRPPGPLARGPARAPDRR